MYNTRQRDLPTIIMYTIHVSSLMALEQSFLIPRERYIVGENQKISYNFVNTLTSVVHVPLPLQWQSLFSSQTSALHCTSWSEGESGS